MCRGTPAENHCFKLTFFAHQKYFKFSNYIFFCFILFSDPQSFIFSSFCAEFEQFFHLKCFFNSCWIKIGHFCNFLGLQPCNLQHFHMQFVLWCLYFLSTSCEFDTPAWLRLYAAKVLRFIIVSGFVSLTTLIYRFPTIFE